MKKIEFKNLPSTETPLSAENLNQLQSNIEESCVAINSTQPTTNEKLWVQKTNTSKKIYTKNEDGTYEKFLEVLDFETVEEW